MASVDVKQLLGWLEEGDLTKAALRTWCRCQLLAEEAEAEGLVLININQTAMAREMGVSSQMVSKSFKELHQLGLLAGKGE